MATTGMQSRSLEELPLFYKLSMVLSTIAGIAFVLGGLGIFLGVHLDPSWFPMTTWGMMIGGVLGVLVFISMYPSLREVNRPVAIVAVALGIFNFLYYAANQALSEFYGAGIAPDDLGLPEIFTPLLYDYPVGLSILLIGWLGLQAGDTIPKGFAIVSLVAAALVFLVSPLGFFVFAGIGLHVILLSTQGVWCLECVRRRFLLREREMVRERG